MTDARFTEAAHKVLRDHFGHRPALSVQQLLSPGFAEKKMACVLEALQLVRSKHAELTRRRPSSTAASPRGTTPLAASPRTAHKAHQPHMRHHLDLRVIASRAEQNDEQRVKMPPRRGPVQRAE